MELKQFTRQAIEAFETEHADNLEQIVRRDITDRFFCFIQGNRLWMKNYLDTVAETGNLQYVNSQIAQFICGHYGLHNNGVECKHPYSFLIQSYHELER